MFGVVRIYFKNVIYADKIFGVVKLSMYVEILLTHVVQKLYL